jgi:hypothetical protein
MHRLSWIELAKAWLYERRMALGLAPAVLLVLALCLLALPIRRPEPVMGTVISLGLSNTGRTGGEPAAVVSVDGRRVSVVLPHAHLCAVGGPIRLLRSTGWLGTRYSDQTPPCPTSGAEGERPAPAPRARGS